MCCTTNKGSRLRTNANTLRSLMGAATLTLCMDADLEFDASVPSFLSSVFDPQQIEVHRYTKQKLPRSIEAHYQSRVFETSIKRSLANGEKVALLCRTKANAKIYNEMFKNFNGNFYL